MADTGQTGPLLVLSGPSGIGKSTVIRRLLEEKGWPLRLSVSVTTRPPRPREKDGVDYHFWSRERFQQGLQAGAFLEWAEVFGNYYGTLRDEVEPYRRLGVGVILDIDVQGWEQVKRKCPELVSVFLRSASPATFEKRLRARGTESEEAITRRLQGAARELARADAYDYQVINEELETALAEMRGILQQTFERTRHAG